MACNLSAKKKLKAYRKHKRFFFSSKDIEKYVSTSTISNVEHYIYYSTLATYYIYYSTHLGSTNFPTEPLVNFGTSYDTWAENLAMTDSHKLVNATLKNM